MKVSVVVVTFNDCKNLQITLDAIKKQNYANIEVVIVDGGSKDETVDVIKKFHQGFQGEVKWISEKDRGLYDGLNKGIKMATGDIITGHWDVYANENVISKVVDVITKDGTDGAHGDLVYMDGEEPVRYWKMGKGKIKDGWMPAQPTLFLKREIFEKYGSYDISFRISGDFDFMNRFLKDGSVKLSYIPEVLVYMYYGGVSTTGMGAYKKSIEESVRSLKKNGYAFPRVIILKRTIRTVFQFLNRKKYINGVKL